MKPTNIRNSLILIFFSFFFFSFSSLSSKEIRKKTALIVALNAYSENSGIAQSSLEILDVFPFEINNKVVFWIINFKPNGFIIISSDDNAKPILGYGLNSNLRWENTPPALSYLLKQYGNEINRIKEYKIIGSRKIKEKWEKLSSMNYVPLKSYTIGTPLLETVWGQSNGYNQECPEYPGTSTNCLVGCNAVAIGQILHYWGDRVFPDGSKSYTPDNFSSSITVHFYNESYNWNAMNHSSSDSDNETLLFDCGVAVEANYGLDVTSAYISKVSPAFYSFFGFQTDPPEVQDDFELSAWINMLKDEIDQGRPVYCFGRDLTLPNVADHSWVIDGYDTNNTFHCNWGWYGDENGYFSLTSFTTDDYDFDTTLGAIMGIEPILDGSSTFSGQEIICYPGTITYSVEIPSSASVEWSLSNGNLTQIGGNTGTSYQVRATSAFTRGECTITATIKNSQGQTFFVKTKVVYVGTPPPDISYAYDPSTNTQVAMPIAGEEYYFQLFTDNPSTTSSDYVWGIDPPFGSEYFPWIDNGKQIYFTAPEPGIYTFSAKQNWTCGWSNFATEYIEFYESGYFLMFTPNPSSGETELMIELEVETAFDVNEEWDLEVYDSKQLLKEKKSRLKGQSYKFQTSGWREGIYIVRVKFKDQVLQGKLVVKK